MQKKKLKIEKEKRKSPIDNRFRAVYSRVALAGSFLHQRIDVLVNGLEQKLENVVARQVRQLRLLQNLLRVGQ